MLFHGWSVQSAPQIVVSPVARDYKDENASLETDRERIALDIIRSVKGDFENEPFAETRAAVVDPRPLFRALAG